MESMQEMETLLTCQLVSRGLERVTGQLAFAHKGQVVALKADETIYRGYFIAVLESGHKVREFRSGAGAFDWDAIAATIVGVAERRLRPENTTRNAIDFGAAGNTANAGLWTM